MKTGNEANNGTIEMLFYLVNNKEYAVAIEDVDEIIHIEEVVGVPNSHRSIMGLALVRDEILSVIDMSMVLDGTKMNSIDDKIMLKAHNLDINLAFCVDSIIGIVRVEPHTIEKNNELSNNLVVSNVKHNNRIYMLLNYDRIVEEIKQ